jgi:hypothetical protein
MAPRPKPKTMAADGVLDAAAPLPQAPPVADVTPAPLPEAAPVVRVRAMQPVRWRIGRAFGAEPVDIPAADLTLAEADMLMADPLLSVTVIDPD